VCGWFSFLVLFSFVFLIDFMGYILARFNVRVVFGMNIPFCLYRSSEGFKMGYIGKCFTSIVF
jgi:hypothetical protein